MSPVFYVLSALVVFLFSGLLAMAGIGAAFLFVPFFYYLGVSLAEATPMALLLNVVSLLLAAINYWRGKLGDRPERVHPVRPGAERLSHHVARPLQRGAADGHCPAPA